MNVVRRKLGGESGCRSTALLLGPALQRELAASGPINAPDLFGTAHVGVKPC